jgi:hypothetical protein
VDVRRVCLLGGFSIYTTAAGVVLISTIKPSLVELGLVLKEKNQEKLWLFFAFASASKIAFRLHRFLLSFLFFPPSETVHSVELLIKLVENENPCQRDSGNLHKSII